MKSKTVLHNMRAYNWILKLSKKLIISQGMKATLYYLEHLINQIIILLLHRDNNMNNVFCT